MSITGSFGEEEGIKIVKPLEWKMVEVGDGDCGGAKNLCTLGNPTASRQLRDPTQPTT